MRLRLNKLSKESKTDLGLAGDRMPVFQDSTVTGDNSSSLAILAKVHPFSLSSLSLACTVSFITPNNTIQRRLLSIGDIP
jgi:hypothetical protein